MASVLDAQVVLDRFETLEDRLDEYAIQEPKINKVIDISITGSVDEFALAFSRETKLNLTVDPSIKDDIVTNFSETRPKDILLHLCRFYNLDLTFSGSIIGLVPFEEEVPEAVQREINVSFNDYNNKLQLDLRADTLDAVLKKISEVSKINVIGTDAISNVLLNGYFGATDFEKALGQLATRNNLELIKKAEDYYIFDRKVAPGKEAKLVDNKSKRKSSGRSGKRKKATPVLEDEDAFFDLTIDKSNNLVNVEAIKVPLSTIIKKAAEETRESYYLFDELESLIDLNLEAVSFEQLLIDALSGTEYSFKKQGKIYLIGGADKVGVMETKVYQFQHRTVKEISNFIPEDLAAGVNIIEFLQLNSVILSGPASNMDMVLDFLREVDRSVPVIMIELLIVDVQKNHEIRAGLEAGIANEPVPAGGEQFFLDLTLRLAQVPSMIFYQL